MRQSAFRSRQSAINLLNRKPIADCGEPSKSMKSLGKFLSSKYRIDAAPRKGKIKMVDEKTIFFLATKIIEEEYGKKGVASVFPRYYKDGKLFLSGKSSLWVEEMKVFRADFIRRLAESGADTITDIKVSHEYGR